MSLRACFASCMHQTKRTDRSCAWAYQMPPYLKKPLLPFRDQGSGEQNEAASEQQDVN